MILSRLRRHRLTPKLLTLLAAIWLSLALQPCAMAFVPMIPDQAEGHSHCPQCPDHLTKKSADCYLTDWQLIKSVSGSASLDLPSSALMPFILLQYAQWQPVTAGTAPPPPDTVPPLTDLPVFRQDILRL